jgi:hypothetical protein
MKQAFIGFYASLNDFLPSEKKGQVTVYTFEVTSLPATVCRNLVLFESVSQDQIGQGPAHPLRAGTLAWHSLRTNDHSIVWGCAARHEFE